MSDRPDAIGCLHDNIRKRMETTTAATSIGGDGEPALVAKTAEQEQM